MKDGNTTSSHISVRTPVTPREFAELVSLTGDYPACARIAVAVSGGSDSMALLLLLAGWAAENGAVISALTVDHGLRPESAAEAKNVGRRCVDLGISHHTLIWRDKPPESGLQEKARKARYALMESWCVESGVTNLFLGHTKNDQAETFLFRMSRGSGPDGLAAMPIVSFRDGLRIVRPLLSVGRERLKATLRAFGNSWVEDPGNTDRRFARVRVRQQLAELEAHGISVSSIAGTAQAFGRLRAARENLIAALADRIVVQHLEGYAEIDRPGLIDANQSIARSLISALITRTGGTEFPPRRAQAERLFAEIVGRRSSVILTLGRCVVTATVKQVRLWREPETIRDEIQLDGETRAIWDGRFVLDLASENAPAGASVSVLGRAGWEAIAAKTSRVYRRLPGPVRHGLPAVWLDGDILQVWHLGYRSSQTTRNIVENAVFRPRSPISKRPLWVA